MQIFTIFFLLAHYIIDIESKVSSLLTSYNMNHRLSIIIGNKSYSSWSMRPWLAIRHVSQSKTG